MFLTYISSFYLVLFLICPLSVHYSILLLQSVVVKLFDVAVKSVAWVEAVVTSIVVCP